MNKEFNSLNYQAHPHQEGQQQNISRKTTDRGINEPPEVQNIKNDSSSRKEGEEGRSENSGGESDSERTNRNEDKGIRGGASSL